MRRRVVRIVLLLAGSFQVFPGSRAVRAAFEGLDGGADTFGMSSVGVSLRDPLLVPFVNPATDFDVPGWRLSTSYSRRFNMQELDRVGFSFSVGWRDLLVSVGGERFGGELYREETVVLGLGLPVAERTRTGLAARLHRLAIAGYGSAAAVGFDWAWYSEPIERLRVGAVWRNLNLPELGVSGVVLPGGLIVGISGEVADRVTCSVEGRKTMGGGVESGFGFAFLVSRELVLRAGYRRETGEYSLGSTLHLPFFRWDYAISFHPALGITHDVTLSIGRRTATPRYPRTGPETREFQPR